MARRWAARYCGGAAEYDDLMQVANLALVKAVRGFDPERGAFESYASATVSGELKKHLRDHCWTIRPPRRLQELQSRILVVVEERLQETGQHPTPSEVAALVDEPLEAISEALVARSCFWPASLDRPSAEGRSLAEVLPDDQDGPGSVDRTLAVRQICRHLAPEDRRLIWMRFYEGLTQRAIAEQLGVSQMQVSRRLSRLLEDLRPLAEPLNVA